MKDLFCVKPFQMIDIKKGQTGLCCWVDLQTWQGATDEMTMEKVWNSAEAQDIRASIHDGSFKHCKDNCPFLNSKTEQLTEAYQIDDDFDEFLQVIDNPVLPKDKIISPHLRQVIEQQLTELPYLPPMLECGFDFSCNLSCPSCREEKIIELDRKEEIQQVQAILEQQAFGSVETLYITGSGDPFGSPFFNKWLRQLDKSMLPKLKNIHLHSNGQLWNEHAWLKIPANIREYIKTAEISIDAASDETYRINRRGGEYSKLLKNLEFISDLRAQGLLKHLKIHMVVQQNNYHEMADFVALGERFNADVIYFSRLTDWGTFTQEDLHFRQIHRRTHPQHGRFLQHLQHAKLKLPQVDLGNLTDFVTGAEPLAPIACTQI